MKSQPRQIALTFLEEIARQLTFEALKGFTIPDEIRDKVTRGVMFEGIYRLFELYIPGDRPSDAVLISRVRINALSGKAEGPVEVFNLQPKV